jgi:hypothetical protein
MTMNCNWLNKPPQTTEQQESQWLINTCRLFNRRWTLLQRFHSLPDRVRKATQSYFFWFCDQGWSARPVDYIETANYSIHWQNRNWLSFATGGAQAWVRAYDLGLANTAKFLAGSVYMHDFNTSAQEIRCLHQSVQDLLTYTPNMHAGERHMGEVHAAYWIEQNRIRSLNTSWRKPPPPPLHEQPPGFLELIELEQARSRGAIQ